MTSEEYIKLISREPSLDMISEAKNKDGKVEYRYIKKSILQRELLNIFEGHTKWDMERDNVAKGGLWGKGVLHYKNPVSGEWLFVSGTASLPHDKKMRLNYPNLESHCMINACKKIGVWFGQNLNIDEEDAILDDEVPETNIEHERWEKLIDDCNSPEELAVYKPQIPKELTKFYMDKLKSFTKNVKSNGLLQNTH